MRLALLVSLVACGGGSSNQPSGTTVTSTESSSDPAGTGGSGAPPITDLRQPKPAPPPAPVTAPPPPTSAPAPKKPLYSCFSYIAANTTKRRHNCMRTQDCPDLVEQAKQIKGIRELTGCTSVASVWCFHQVVKGDAMGIDVCQPTAEDCTATRAAAVKAKESVDTDCTER